MTTAASSKNRLIQIMLINLLWAILRTIFDIFWTNYWIIDKMPVITYMHIVYEFMLYFFNTGLIIIISEKLFNTQLTLDNYRNIFFKARWVWIVYPLVSFLSCFVFHESVTGDFKILENIPTFMKKYNYFPYSMMVVIPIIIGVYYWSVVKDVALNYFKLLASIIIALTVTYLLFYQYFFDLFMHLRYTKNVYCSIGFYNFPCLLAIFFTIKPFREAFNIRKQTIVYIVGINLLVSALIFIYGWWFV
jgi:hypothetical protein